MEQKKAKHGRPDDQLFHDVFTASPIGIALEDLEGRPFFVNPALCSMLGFNEEEIRNTNCDFSPPEDAEKDRALFKKLRAGSIDHYDLEKRFLRRDGSLMWGRLSIRLVNRLVSPLVLAMLEDVTEKKTGQEELLRSEADLQKLKGQVVHAQEQERAWIARELHDNIHQQIVLLSINLEWLQRNLPEVPTEVIRKISAAREQLVTLSTDIHTLSHHLHPAKLEYLGLSAVAASLCRELSDRHGVRIAFRCEWIPKMLAKEISLCLYRALQESLQNAIDHSGSRTFQVSLNVESNEIHLTVRDWGSGFDPEQAMKGSGLGLGSMRERVHIVKGSISIKSKPQCGTEISIRVPLRKMITG